MKQNREPSLAIFMLVAIVLIVLSGPGSSIARGPAGIQENADQKERIDDILYGDPQEGDFKPGQFAAPQHPSAETPVSPARITVSKLLSSFSKTAARILREFR